MLLRLLITAVLIWAVQSDDGWTTVTYKKQNRSVQQKNADQKKISGNPNTQNDQWLHGSGFNRVHHAEKMRLSVPEYVIIVPHVPDNDLQRVSTVLFQKDVNNMAGKVDIIFESGNSNVVKSFKLRDQLMNKPTFKALNKLLSLYQGKMTKTSYVNPILKEKLENEFLQEIMKTPVIQNLFSYLTHTNIPLTTVTKQRDFLKKIWFTKFTRYSSPKRVNGNIQPMPMRTAEFTSSAFAHVFRGEKQSGGISGMHNWYFMYEYLQKGDLKIAEKHSFPYFDPRNNEVLVDLKTWSVTYGGVSKLSTVLFGVSPELEVALGTLCFIYRTNKPCTLALGNHKMAVQVFPWGIRHHDVLVISSYFPVPNPYYNPRKDDMAPLQRRHRQHFPGSYTIPIRVWG